VGIAGLLLAAGEGRRYGRPKALVTLDDGMLLVDRAAGVLRDGGCAPVVVVLGAAADTVRAAAALEGVSVVGNPLWSTGMGSSLRAGLAALASTEADAAVVLLVDTPGIPAAAVARLREAAATEPATALVMATYGGKRGHPVLLGRAHWHGVAELAVGDVGARPYLAHRRVIEIACDDIADPTDMDVPGTRIRPQS
jgi:CTP:molybdopterin cytidylyltransferase MocA